MRRIPGKAQLMQALPGPDAQLRRILRRALVDQGPFPAFSSFKLLALEAGPMVENGFDRDIHLPAAAAAAAVAATAATAAVATTATAAAGTTTATTTAAAAGLVLRFVHTQ